MKRCLPVLAFLSVVTLLIVFRLGRYHSLSPSEGLVEQTPTAVTASFCSKCHHLPTPDLLPKSAWPAQIQKMFAMYRSQTPFPEPGLPTVNEVAAYYVKHAPDELAMDQVAAPEVSSDKRLRRDYLEQSMLSKEPAASACVRVLPFNQQQRVLAADWRTGSIWQFEPSAWTKSKLTDLNAVSQVRITSIPRETPTEYLVTSLGQNLPSPAKHGAVWNLQISDDGSVRGNCLISGIRRVADALAFDFDRDGFTDIVVAEFGFMQSGGISLWMNDGSMDSPFSEPHLLDSRAGSTHLAVHDLDGDGRLDIIASISQETESVVAFLNKGAPDFSKRTLFQAEHPAWGLCGLQMIDLDGDGDQDFVVINGDTLDNEVLKPYHGVGWLENLGEMEFSYRSIAPMPGVYCTKAGDLDGDGDIDIAAAAWLPLHWPDNTKLLADFPSVVWFEQITRGKFEMHVLEKGMCVHPALDLGDLDEDGDLDLVVSNFYSGVYYQEFADDPGARQLFTIFRNRSQGQP